MIGYGIDLEMTVNHIPVKRCICSSALAGVPHWSHSDIVEALGRTPLAPDAIRVTAKVRPIADHDGTPAEGGISVAAWLMAAHVE